jgi:hypothetical protein
MADASNFSRDETIVRLRVVAIGIICSVFVRLTILFLELSVPAVRRVSDSALSGLLPECASMFAFWLIAAGFYLWSWLSTTRRGIFSGKDFLIDVGGLLAIWLILLLAAGHGERGTGALYEICMTAYGTFIVLFLRPFAVFRIIQQRRAARRSKL